MIGIVFTSYDRATDWFEQKYDYEKSLTKNLTFNDDGKEYKLLYAKDINECQKYRGFSFTSIEIKDNVAIHVGGFFKSIVFPIIVKEQTMKTRFDSLPIDKKQKDDIMDIKESAEGLAKLIDMFGMDARLKARAKSALEDVVLFAVKGISRK